MGSTSKWVVIAAAIAMTLVGCSDGDVGGEKTPTQSVSPSPSPTSEAQTPSTALPEVMPDCPNTYGDLPELTLALAEGLLGSPMIWCDATMTVASGAPVVVDPTPSILAVDGIALPAEVEYEGHPTGCKPDDEDFAVLLGDSWYRARKADCWDIAEPLE